jgi:hypothetical protein
LASFTATGSAVFRTAVYYGETNFVIVMPVAALHWFFPKQIPPFNILLESNEFYMFRVRVDTSPVPAKMVYSHALWDFPRENLIAYPGRSFIADGFIYPDTGIPFLIDIASPNPTAILIYNAVGFNKPA